MYSVPKDGFGNTFDPSCEPVEKLTIKTEKKRAMKNIALFKLLNSLVFKTA